MRRLRLRRPPPRRRPFRAALLTLVALVALAGAALLALTRTDAGRAEIARLVERLASGPGASLRIGRLEGAVPFDMTLRDVALADAEGTWLTVDRARLAWHPGALLSGRLDIAAVEVGRLSVARPPRAEAGPAGGPPGLPRLPLGVAVKRLGIAEIDLGAPLLGVPARLSLEGAARLLDPSEGLSAELALARIDGTEGRIDARLRFAPETQHLDMAVTASEPAGGLVSRLARLPDLPAVTLSVVGAGPLDAWRGDLALDLADKGSARGLVDLRRVGAARSLSGRLEADVGRAMPAGLAPLLDGKTTLAVDASFGDDGRVGVDHVELAAAAGMVSATGSYDRTGGALAGQVRLTVGDAHRFAALLPAAARWMSLDVDLSAGGTAKAPTVRMVASARGLAFDGERVDRLALTLGASGDGPLMAADTRFSVVLDGRAEGLASRDPALARALGGGAVLSGRGRADRTGQVEIAEARIELAALSARYAGAAGPRSVKGKVTVERADLAALRAFADRPFAGQVRLAADIDLAPDLGRLAVTLDGSVDNLRTGMAQVDGLAGPSLRLTGGLQRAMDGSFGFRNLTLDAAHARLVADGSATAARANVAARLLLPDLARLDPRLAGRGEVSATLTGSLARLDARAGVVLADARAVNRPIERLTLDLEVKDVLAAPGGTLALDGTVDGKPARGAGRFTRDAAGRTRIEGLRLDLGSVALAAEAALDAQGRATGRLSLAAGDLGDVGPLLLAELAGKLDLKADLFVVDGRQAADLRGTAERVAAFGTTLRRADVDMKGRDLLGTPTLDGRLDLAGLASGGLAVPRAAATAKGDAGGTEVVLDAVAQGIDLAARARIAPAGDGLEVALRTFSALRGADRVELAREARLTVADGGVRIAGLELRAGRGRLVVDGVAGRRLDLRAKAEALPLALADLAAPDLGLTGTLGGELSLSGEAARPDGRYRLGVEGLSSAALRGAGLRPFAVTASGTLAGGRTSVDAVIRDALNASVTLRGSAPLDTTGALDLAVAGRLDLATLNDLLADGQRAAGTAVIDLGLRGTPAAPAAQGSLRIVGGRFEDVVNGLYLDRVEATVTGSQRALTIASLSAATRNGGTIGGSGRIALDPAAGFPGQITLRAANAQLVASEITNATASLDLSVSGPLAREPKVAGRIEVANLDVNLPDRLPFSATPIAVRHVNAPPRVRARLAAEQKRAAARSRGGGALVAVLDVTVAAPSRVFVRGQGINAELGGTLAIGGTSAAPQVSGAFDMRRGTFSLLGRRLTFTRGTIGFPGGGVDPELDFLAEAPAGDVTARVAVTGRASQPKLAFSASPELPQDEVLARLLFGRPSGSLTASQTIRLAQAVAQLTGLGGRGLDDLSRSLGIDAIDIGASENGGVAVGIGKRINDNIYVGVKQGATPGSSAVTVDIDVTKNIKVQGEVGAEGKTAVGVGMEWDY